MIAFATAIPMPSLEYIVTHESPTVPTNRPNLFVKHALQITSSIPRTHAQGVQATATAVRMKVNATHAKPAITFTKGIVVLLALPKALSRMNP